MRHRPSIHLAFVVVLALLAAGCREVETGRRSLCRVCGQILASDVTTRSVPLWSDSTSLRVDTDRSTYCAKCGDEQVTVVREKRCEHCGKVYQSDRFTAKRSEERKDEKETVGYCSGQCQNYALAQSAAERTSEAARNAGDALGRGLEAAGRLLRR